MNRPGRAVADTVLLLLAGIVACVSLAGCATQSIDVPKEVRVPTPVPSVDAAKRPQRPPLRADEDLLVMDRGRRTLAAWADRQRMAIYTAELEAVVEGCARIPAR